ncbi:MCP methyltransferase, CheR-type [Alkalidesulfovibrio alkalitolerans DSM 16529]|uniref:protein-glutamate O-methyltransferase n=1 Tax=Alkalidesulfovibrio alkalitolerans DSM 16529 TaxID=1121439 RepID=S7TET2_9BACT|nr:protein-glutamate O-methyltransferase CheR [Alkalidesulfovibrio alkalitolerans]EPR35692.1 MCP methyltransferase, CheR-type [Alkalidesulfovibrio alkalitolerans DSM 16529]
MSLLEGSLTLRAAPKITPDEFTAFREFIYQISGIDIPERRQYLIENRLGPRVKELRLPSFGEYLKYLKFSREKQAELERLFELITTNETSFFRDQRQLDVVRDKLLAPLLEAQEKAGRKELRIWSAGCSSGEEPYTLAIMLHELLRMKILGWRIDIMAHDLSPAMIARAKLGVYGDYSFKTTPPDMVERYFIKKPEGFEVHPKVKKLVRFGTINLNSPPAIKVLPKSHIVFCRNVIIYFDQEMKKKVLASFYDNLVPGGHLVLGHSETIHGVSRVFTPVHHPGGIVYRREG